MDLIVVTGTVQDHNTNRKPNRRKFRTVELNIFPTYVPRELWRKDLEAVGHAWTERGKKEILCGSVRVSADVFYSLIPCLAVNHFRELHVKVLNLRHREGSIDVFSLDHERLSEKFPD